MPTAWKLEEVLGEKLIDWEVNTAKDSVSDCDEIILHFTNGKEILIFVHPEDGLQAHGD